MIKQLIFRKMIQKAMKLNKPLAEIRKDLANMKVKTSIKKTTYLDEAIINDVKCLWVIPEGCDTQNFVMYFHGGGYCLGVYAHTIQRTIELAEHLERTVLMVDYPLAPENPFPSAVNKSIEIYQVLSKGKNIALLGESSGCGLVLNIMVHLREQHQKQPVCALMLTPFLDASLDRSIQAELAKKDPFYVEKPYVVSDYYIIGHDPKDPMISPIYHELNDLAPILIHTAQYDVLATDGETLKNKLQNANGEVVYQEWQFMWHLFHTHSKVLSESAKAMDLCKSFLDEKYDCLG